MFVKNKCCASLLYLIAFNRLFQTDKANFLSLFCLFMTISCDFAEFIFVVHKACSKALKDFFISFCEFNTLITA